MPAVDYSRLAEHYDALVTFEADIPFFLAECREIGGRVLELMSGTGRVSLPLVAAGVDLTCLDSSSDMLQRLEDKLRRCKQSAVVLREDVTRLELVEIFDLVILPFNSFQELIDPAHQREALRRVHRALKPRGRFVCTLHNPNVKLRTLPRQPTVVARAPDGDFELQMQLNVCHDPTTGIVKGTETLLTVDPAGEILSEQELSLRYVLVSESDFRALAEGVGFKVLTLFGDYDKTLYECHTSPSMIWRLEK